MTRSLRKKAKPVSAEKQPDDKASKVSASRKGKKRKTLENGEPKNEREQTQASEEGSEVQGKVQRRTLREIFAKGPLCESSPGRLENTQSTDVATKPAPPSPRTGKVANSPAKKRSKLSLKGNKEGVGAKQASVQKLLFEKGEGQDKEPNSNTTEADKEKEEKDQLLELVKPPCVAALHNLGNTCFLNSVLQVLRYTPDFKSSIAELAKEIKYTQKEKSLLANLTQDGSEDNEEILTWRLIISLQDTFRKMQVSEDRYRKGQTQYIATRPYDLLDTIEKLNPMFEGNLQQDAHELLRCLLAYIQDAAKEINAYRSKHRKHDDDKEDANDARTAASGEQHRNRSDDGNPGQPDTNKKELDDENTDQTNAKDLKNLDSETVESMEFEHKTTLEMEIKTAPCKNETESETKNESETKPERFPGSGGQTENHHMETEDCLSENEHIKMAKVKTESNESTSYHGRNDDSVITEKPRQYEENPEVDEPNLSQDMSEVLLLPEDSASEAETKQNLSDEEGNENHKALADDTAMEALQEVKFETRGDELNVHHFPSSREEVHPILGGGEQEVCSSLPGGGTNVEGHSTLPGGRADVRCNKLSTKTKETTCQHNDTNKMETELTLDEDITVTVKDKPVSCDFEAAETSPRQNVFEMFGGLATRQQLDGACDDADPGVKDTRSRGSKVVSRSRGGRKIRMSNKDNVTVGEKKAEKTRGNCRRTRSKSGGNAGQGDAHRELESNATDGDLSEKENVCEENDQDADPPGACGDRKTLKLNRKQEVDGHTKVLIGGKNVGYDIAAFFKKKSVVCLERCDPTNGSLVAKDCRKVSPGNKVKSPQNEEKCREKNQDKNVSASGCDSGAKVNRLNLQKSESLSPGEKKVESVPGDEKKSEPFSNDEKKSENMSNDEKKLDNMATKNLRFPEDKESEAENFLETRRTSFSEIRNEESVSVKTEMDRECVPENADDKLNTKADQEAGHSVTGDKGTTILSEGISNSDQNYERKSPPATENKVQRTPSKCRRVGLPRHRFKQQRLHLTKQGEKGDDTKETDGTERTDGEKSQTASRHAEKLDGDEKVTDKRKISVDSESVGDMSREKRTSKDSESGMGASMDTQGKDSESGMGMSIDTQGKAVDSESVNGEILDELVKSVDSPQKSPHEKAPELDQVSGEFVGKSVELDGKSVELDGKSSESDGKSVELDGKSVELDGKSVELDGKSVELDGKSEFDGKPPELERKSEFDGKSSQLDGKSVGPHTESLGSKPVVADSKLMASDAGDSTKSSLDEEPSRERVDQTNVPPPPCRTRRTLRDIVNKNKGGAATETEVLSPTTTLKNEARHNKSVVRIKKCSISQYFRRPPHSAQEVPRRTDAVTDCVESLFQGEMALRTKCLVCERYTEKKEAYQISVYQYTERKEAYQDISVPVKKAGRNTHTHSIDASPSSSANHRTGANLSDDEEEDLSDPSSWIFSSLAEVECLRDDNKYFCDNCLRLGEAQRSMHYVTPPELLTLHVKRFAAMSGYFGGFTKISDYVPTPFILPCIQDRCRRQCTLENHRYELYGVITHTGFSISSGHYVAYVKAPPGTKLQHPPLSTPVHKLDGNSDPTEEHQECASSSVQVKEPLANQNGAHRATGPGVENRLGNLSKEIDPGSENSGSSAKEQIDTMSVAQPAEDVKSAASSSVENSELFTASSENCTENSAHCVENSTVDEPVWYECDDEIITEMAEARFTEILAPGSSSTPYMLFYRRVGSVS